MKYKVIHPTYIAEWSEIISLEKIQAKTNLSFEKAHDLVSSLVDLGWLILLEELPVIDTDINGDGKFDSKDLTLSAKILNKGKKKKATKS